MMIMITSGCNNILMKYHNHKQENILTPVLVFVDFSLNRLNALSHFAVHYRTAACLHYRDETPRMTQDLAVSPNNKKKKPVKKRFLLDSSTGPGGGWGEFLKHYKQSSFV